MSEIVTRLKAAVPAPEARNEKFLEWLGVVAEQQGLLPEEYTEAKKSELRLQFEENLYSEVLTNDLLEACKAVKEPSQIVRDLKKGALGAPRKPDADGKPRKVLIRTKDLEHLLGAGSATSGSTPPATPPPAAGT